MYSLRRHRLKVLILVVAAAVVFVSLSLFSDARPVEQLSEAELYIHTPNTVPEDVIITTEAQEAPLVIADSATTTGVTPTSANYYTYTSDTDINARFTGLLSHVYWLFERASGEGSIRSATVINTDQSFFDRQIERTTDDLSDSINDASENLEDDLSALDSRLVLAEDALADLSISAASTSVMAANLTLNGHWLSGDGDDEGVFVDDNGRVGVGPSTFPVALGLPTLSVNGSGAFYNNTNNAVTALYIASEPSAGTGFPVIGLLDQRSGGFQWNIENSRNGDGSLGFYRSGIGSRMVLSAAGNLGIGTTTPNTKLSVIGDSYITGTTTLLGSIRTNAQSDTITFVGVGAGVSNTVTGIGEEGMNNSGFGNNALSSNTTGRSNTANGKDAMFANTTGSDNTAVGRTSLFSNTSGNYNSALGVSALNSNITGTYNTASGRSTLLSNTTGSYNTADGASALRLNVTGSYNTALGYQAGYDMNTATSTGANTFLGYNTGRGIVTGINNTILGANVTGLSSTLSNNIIIADGAGNQRINVDASGNVGIGTTTPAYKLHVVGEGGDQGLLTLQYADNTAKRPLLHFRRSRGTNAAPLDVIGGDQVGEIIFQAFIDSSYKSVASIRAEMDTTIGSSSYPSELTFFTTESGSITRAERMRIDSAGNVGIGTSTPNSRLTVQVTAGQNPLTIASSSGAASLALLANGNLELPGQLISAGVDWTTRASAADYQWQSVTYGNGLFVAVSLTGTGNRVMTSPDGVNWTTASTPIDNGWRSVTYGNGLFVAVASTGTGNRVMTSPDGVNWTLQSTPEDNSWHSVTYGNGLFVAVSYAGSSNRVMTSPDGVNWTARASSVNNSWQSVTYGNGLFVAVSVDGTGDGIMTSPDGINWTSQTSPADNAWRDVTYRNGLFVAVAVSGSGNGVMTSPDGINWTARASSVDNSWRSVTYGNGLFVAVSFTGAGDGVMTSGKIQTSALVHNNLYQGGMNIMGNVGIGTTTPGSVLTVVGDINVSGKYLVGSTTALYVPNQDQFLNSMFIGDGGQNQVYTSGNDGRLNTAVGLGSLFSNITGYANTAVGQGSLNLNTTGNNNTAIGRYTLATNNGGNNVGVGNYSLYQNTTGSYNTSVGHDSLRENTTGERNTALGRDSLGTNTTGLQNTAIGHTALRFNVTGSYNTALGYQAGYDMNTATSTGANTFLGYNTGRGIVTGVNNTILGANVTGLSSTLSNNIIIADGAGNQRINVDASGNVGIGTTTPSSKLSVAGDIHLTGALLAATGTAGIPAYSFANDPNTGMFNQAANVISFATNGIERARINSSGSFDLRGNGNILFGGAQTLYSTSSNVYLGTNTIVSFGTNNMMLGNFAGNSADGDYNNFTGAYAGQLADGDYNNFMGYQAGQLASGASYSNFIGHSAGLNSNGIFSNYIGFQTGYNAGGSWNDFIGYQAGLNAASATSSVIIGANAYFGGASYSASNNTVIGAGAGYFARTGADNNVLIGYQAADNLTFCANNIVIGYDVDIASAAGSNQLNIGNIIFGTGIDGTGTTLSSGNIGIGTTTPAEKLTVVGTIQSTALLGSSTNLTTDASGNIIRDPSDARLKENVTTIENALDTVLVFRGVRYER